AETRMDEVSCQTEGRFLAQGIAVRVPHRGRLPAAAQAPRELPAEPALARARRRGDEHHPRLSLADTVRDHLLERGELPVPSDKRGRFAEQRPSALEAVAPADDDSARTVGDGAEAPVDEAVRRGVDADGSLLGPRPAKELRRLVDDVAQG